MRPLVTAESIARDLEMLSPDKLERVAALVRQIGPHTEAAQTSAAFNPLPESCAIRANQDVLHDKLRLLAVRETDLLDSPPQSDLDLLVRLVSSLLNAPVAILSLVDSDRQFFIGSTGLPDPLASRREAPLRETPCQHVVSSNASFVLRDASRNPLCQKNSTVSELNITAYLGVPLRAHDGYVLGSLCAIDSNPRAWTAAELTLLEDLARIAMGKLELRRSLHRHVQAEDELRKSEGRLLAIFDSAPSLIYLKDLAGRYLFVNRSFSELLNLNTRDILGKTASDLFPPQLADRFRSHDAEALTDGPREAEELMPQQDGNHTYLSVRFAVKDSSGQPYATCGISSDITRRRRLDDIREDLYRTTELIAAIVTSSDDAILSKDLNGNVTSWNAGAERMLGFSEAEMLGTPIARVVPSEKLAEESEIMGRVLQGQRTHNLETWRLRKDGHPIEVSISLAPLRNASGGIIGASTIISDITGRKNRERRQICRSAVNKSLANSGSLVAAAPAIIEAICASEGWDIGAIFELDEGAGELRCVEACHYENRSLQPLEVTFRNLKIAAGTGLLGRVAERAAPVTSEDTASDSDDPASLAAASHKLARAFAFPLLLETRVLGVLGFFGTNPRPVDEHVLEMSAAIGHQVAAVISRWQMTLALQQTDERLRLAMRAASIGAWEIDPLTREMRLDKISRKTFGLRTDAPASLESVMAAIHPEDRADVAARIERALNPAGNGSYEAEFRAIGALDGRIRHLHSKGEATFAYAGRERRVVRFLGTSQDISSRKRAEESLFHANQNLQQFAYAAAHDLQEPLRNVANELGLLQRAMLDNASGEQLELIQSGIEDSRRMHQMVRGLLAFSKVVNGANELGRPVLADKAFQLACNNLRPRIKESGARISCHSLPGVWVREVHMVQLFQNLLENSLKYRKENTTPEIDLSVARNGPDWLFTLTDNGIGFDPAYSERIFGIFKRLHGRGEYDGTGVGLAICLRIVIEHGGRIWAEGRPGEGAKFYFTLPVEKQVLGGLE